MIAISVQFSRQDEAGEHRIGAKIRRRGRWRIDRPDSMMHSPWIAPARRRSLPPGPA